ncbi:MAG: DsrE family protein [Gammaproteobacteria bacterium]|nr:DsrE family protein [Gammaproteobacteria bacterium]
MKPDNELELNAFIDGELSEDQQAEFLESMRDDPELARDVCELSRLKTQVRLAYANPPEPPQRTANKLRASWQTGVAGFVLLTFGLICGWLLHDNTIATSANSERFALLDPEGRGQSPAIDNSETRIVFHLTNPDQVIAGELLSEVEKILAEYKSAGRPLRVEVVGHGNGLALLREGLSQHKPRIHRLANEYANLTFVACQNTIDRLSVDQGVEITLIPDAEVIDSGVTHVVKRQREGWAYIRV